MSSLRYRFVGQDELPRSLTASEVQDYFQLTPEDVSAIRAGRFRRERYLGLALHLAFLRATGCFPAKATVQPRELLQDLCSQLDIDRMGIASLRSIYAAERTITDHRQWVRERCQFRPWDGEDHRRGLDDAMAVWAKSAPSVDDLVQSAAIWLFDNRYVHPGDRPIRDRARSAFAEVEQAAVNAVKAAVSSDTLKVIVQMLGEQAPEASDKTLLEWLKDIPGSPGPANLAEVTDKIDLLKSFGAHAWDLSAITPERLAAFAASVVKRPPYQTLRLSDDSLTTEIVCFLRHRLLELTDQAVFRADRRICDLKRRAYERTETRQAAKAIVYRGALQSVLGIAEDKQKSHATRIEEIVEAVKQQLVDGPTSHAAVVRETLTEQTVMVRPLMNRLLSTLDVQGDAQRKSTKLLKALQQLRDAGAKELPDDFDTSIVPKTWLGLINNPDRAKALQAFEACAMLGIREGIRGGQLWISHSGRFRSRTDSLITVQEWIAQKKQLCSALGLPLSPEEFLAKRRACAQAGLAALSEAVEKGAVTIDDAGLIRLPALSAQDEDKPLIRTRTVFSELIGAAQLPDIIIEIDARTNFSEVLLGRKATDPKELVSIYAALLAHGTEVDAKGVAAMIPDLAPAHVTGAMRSLEAHNRLRKANDRVAEFQRKHLLAAVWDEGKKASADMMSLDASRHLYSARFAAPPA